MCILYLSICEDRKGAKTRIKTIVDLFFTTPSIASEIIYRDMNGTPGVTLVFQIDFAVLEKGPSKDGFTNAIITIPCN